MQVNLLKISFHLNDLISGVCPAGSLRVIEIGMRSQYNQSNSQIGWAHCAPLGIWLYLSSSEALSWDICQYYDRASVFNVIICHACVSCNNITSINTIW